ncbi:MAG: putative Multidrug resistance-associated protein [Streblomastix strix]|uniref:Putative Multidrug resistance-associated protein n=1 Tax=Streblomastix strix TaxID=222440 RepID=A0A5J4WQS7_9EUKA|nr:MAG: putative Multidrug resistance-associated protein [Streblomastix strix]
MKEVLKAVMQKNQSSDELIFEAKFPYSYAVILMLCPFLQGLLDAFADRIFFHFSSHLRSGLAGLIFNKMLKLNITSQSNINTGSLLSLLSTDTNQIAQTFPELFHLIVLPIQIFVPFVFVVIDWGWSSFSMFGIFVGLIPFQAIVLPIMIHSIKGYLIHNDTRNKIINETLQGMRVVKLSGLENIFQKRIEAAREDMFPIKIMPTMGYITMMMMPLSTVTIVIQGTLTVFVSVDRMQAFLILPELKNEVITKPENKQIAVEVNNGSFVWGNPPEIPLSEKEKEEIEEEAEKRKKEAKKEKNKKKEDKNIQLETQTGSLTMVIGTVGSGKSSIGSALIGDIEKQSGEIYMSGSIAYCPQTAWINNNTVRGNITFGRKYKKKKYNEVVHVCALEPDFKTLAAGDQTAIGEKGVNLSGGQKARIQLARAVYSDRDIYILDDPLSAVDAHVGRTLFEECIEGRFAVKRSNGLIHHNLLQHVMNAPNSFYDTTPMGRIHNRFTGDITIIDQKLYMVFLIVASIWIMLVGQIVVIAVDTLWFLAIGLPVLVFFFLLMMLSGRATRNLQRLEAISKSPVLSLFSETINGAGMMIVDNQIELQSRMTSLDRIRFYSSNLPQEVKRSNIDPIYPDNSWPDKGGIEFDNVTFRYRSGLPYVLKGVSFDLKGGEKIGVCGRTGAGKSSLLFALFRLIELDPKLQPTMIDVTTGFKIESDPNEEPNKGIVSIDGIDISKVDLSLLRRSIAIIPQDPTLFTGTLRYNLDIGDKCNDDRIWEVLGMVELKDAISQLPLGLDTQVAEGGSNFSAGQRQLICFGRAILNNCRIVVMDEATASVDVETDAKIQKTIREQFVDKTVIVIAHRLNTIMNNDRIMVMSDGRVVEIDTPLNLKQNQDSSFNGLIRSLGQNYE